ncbi:MAG: hypothetical protein IRZ16_21030 [Myxococcaceae bacterium]|nr:hypothetical protein [Myxococcaceae bacterium]
MKRTHLFASASAPVAGVLAALLFGLSGCPKEQARSPDAGARPNGASATVGLRVRLPPGWSANPAGTDALVAGPKGRGVLRIQRSNEEELPSPEELARGFSENATGLAIEPLDSRRTDDWVAWRARLKSADPKASQATWTVLLAARKAHEGIYLCSTEPGATDAEVAAAADVCAHLGE